MKEIITDVPTDEVGKVVQSFADDGAVEVKIENTQNGTWTVTAQIPTDT